MDSTVTTVLTADMFNGFTEILTGNLAVVIPAALGIFATIWGIRLGISFFKKIAKG